MLIRLFRLNCMIVALTTGGRSWPSLTPLAVSGRPVPGR
jgi:hypothetical protein